VTNGFRWSTALRIAWREGKASRVKFLFVIFGVAVGVGALTGVRGFSDAFRQMLAKEARTLMAGDLAIRQFSDLSPAQQEAVEAYERRGVEVTRVIETVSMMSSAQGGDPVLVSVKAVDPARYPFYGTVKLDPPQPLGTALQAETIAVSDDLLIRLNVAVGGMVKLGAEEFRIAAVTLAEPDRMTGSLNVGPRVLLSRAGLDRTGLMTFGSRASYRFLFRLPSPAFDIGAMRQDLRREFRDALVTDYRETHPAITRALNRSTTFLSLVSLIALIVGALGVATSIRSHLAERLDSIAILKCLGARSSQIIRIYTLETALLGLAGGLAGVAVGSAVQQFFPLLIRRYFPLQHGIDWSPAFALEGVAVGLLASLLFTLPPLLSIRQVRPALIFRREMTEARLPWRRRLRPSLPAAGTGLVILAGIGLIASWLAESARMGMMFVLGLAVSLLALGGVAWLLLRAVRLFVLRAPFRLPVSLRHGLANLYRPGNHAGAVLVSLGIGVMFTLTIYLIQKSLLSEVTAAAPPNAPNVFLINVTNREYEGVQKLLDAAPDLKGPARIVPLVTMRLTKVGVTPVEQLRLNGYHRRAMRARTVTWLDEKPADIEVRQGAWWKPGSAETALSVAEDNAENFGIKVGDLLEWTAAGRTFAVPVAAIHRSLAVAFGGNTDYIFTRAALQGLPVQYFGTARMAPARVAAFQRLTYQKYPTVTVINAAEVLGIVQDVVDQVSLVVRFISAFAILAGAIILASTVAGTRFRRMRETAVLKTLGARRGRLVAIFSVEFLVLGTVAGAMGAGLATLFTRLLMTRLLDASFRFDFLPNAAAVGLTALVAVGAGWLASLRILSQRPLEVLRDE
jgi:putative ABC transport system permease protein